MKRAARVDSNHAEIVAAFEQAGAPVLSLAPLGDGAPDLLVLIHDELALVEVKSAHGKLTPAQRDFHRQWPVRVVRNTAEALAMMKVPR